MGSFVCGSATTVRGGKRGPGVRLQVDQLRSLVKGEHPAFQSDRTLEDMVHALQCGGGSKPSVLVDTAFPDDVLVQSFPGGDYEGLPQDVLVQVEGKWEPKWPTSCVAPGMFVFTRAPSGANVRGTPFLFFMGRLLPDTRPREADRILVQWWLPPFDTQVAFKKGPKRTMVDIFGVWRPVDDIVLAQVREFAHFVLPATILSLSEEVIHSTLALEPDNSISYNDLDILRKDHGIDMTGLAVSATARGNQYRNYVLLKRAI